MNRAPRIPLEDPDDAELIRRVRERDEIAFKTLYQCYYRRLFGFIYRTTGRLDCVEEGINDVMCVVWQKADTFDGSSKPSTWILGIAYKVSLKLLHRNRGAPLADGESIIEQLPCDQDGRRAKQLELDNWLTVAFNFLSEDQRAVIELTYYHGLSYGEIAALMECPENTVKTRMFHARKKLKAIMPKLAASSGTSSLTPENQNETN